MGCDGSWHRPALALFDLDGCLVDSTKAVTGALTHALVEAGLQGHRPEELTWVVGPPLVDSVTTLLTAARADVGLAPSVIDSYRARYKATSLQETEVIDGIPAALDALLAAGTRLAVVTSKPEPFARPLIDGLGLGDRFEALHAPHTDELTEAKSVTLGRALEDLAPGAEPATAVMIGDRSHDIVAGLDRGTRTVGVTWGAGSVAELRDAGAHDLVDHPAELTTLLG